MPGPPPPPPQYTETPEQPPANWVPPADLAEEISNDPNIAQEVKNSVSQRVSNSGANPTAGGDDYGNQTEQGVLSEQKYDNYETGPAPVANYGYGDMNQNDINNDDANGGAFNFLTTGNLLEDLDNMLRIYRMTFDDIERSKLFKQFWKSWDELRENQAKELLKIPTKVRGFLAVLPYVEPYQADQIMKEVLSNGGLLSEPEFIQRRYIFKIFMIYEFGNIFTWIINNLNTLKVVMFLSSLVLSVSIFVHIFIDFYFGNIWRGILMEIMTPLAILSTCQYIDTPFFACVIRVIIEDHCSALAIIPGRLFFSIIVIFFCFSSIDFLFEEEFLVQDIFLLFAVFINLIIISIMFVTYTRLNGVSAHVRILTGSSNKLEQKFLQYDADRDGILNISELQSFFQSFRQSMSKTALEMMIMQYDIQRDNGLRYEAMDIWFKKEPINSDTRLQLLQAKPREFYGIQDSNQAFNEKELEWAGLAGVQQPDVGTGLGDINIEDRAQAHNLALQAMGAS